MVSKSTRGQDIRHALQKLKNEANEKELQLIDVVASIYESAQGAYDSIIETKDQALEKTQDAMTAVNNSVHSHPWQYIGGAAILGFLGGLLLRR